MTANCGYSLKEAKETTMRILDREIFEINIPSTTDINAVMQDLKNFGVKCEIKP